MGALLKEFLFKFDMSQIIILLIVSIRLLYSIMIYAKISGSNEKTRNVLSFLSLLFPIITGIICVVKYRKSTKAAMAIIAALVLSLASTVGIGTAYEYGRHEKYYSGDGTAHIHHYDVSFMDEKGNRYAFDFDKGGYDRFYINGTDEYLNADLCYIDGNGYLHYDDDLSITAKDKTCCVDEDGSIYYPAKYSYFNKDGSINYSFNSANFKYDRFGNAYTYERVPYYDESGNKYSYSFDSVSLKGCYTRITTNETFENEYSLVDEDGYFVYDEKHDFVKQDEAGRIYKDSSGKTYYRASSISWDKNGRLLDAFGKVIE